MLTTIPSLTLPILMVHILTLHILCVVGLTHNVTVHGAISLSDGRKMPPLAFGTGGRNAEKYRAGAAYAAVLDALSIGMRHIDTATFYGTESEVGRAVRDSGIPRSQIWITSKLPVAPGAKLDFNRTLAELRASLSRLGLEYLDLYLIHSPFDRTHRVEQWQALIQAKALGLARSIGTSNFARRHLLELVGEKEQPVINQIELHPWIDQTPTVTFCRERGIAIEAYSPLGPSSHWDDPVMQRIARRHGITVQQVLLRWSLDMGFVPIFGTTSPAHLRSNYALFGWRLAVSELVALSSLDADEHLFWDPIHDAERRVR